MPGKYLLSSFPSSQLPGEPTLLGTGSLDLLNEALRGDRLFAGKELVKSGAGRWQDRGPELHLFKD